MIKVRKLATIISVAAAALSLALPLTSHAGDCHNKKCHSKCKVECNQSTTKKDCMKDCMKKMSTST